MTGPDSAVAALAAGLVQWHATAVFCGRTGEPTVREAGEAGVCTAVLGCVVALAGRSCAASGPAPESAAATC
jgi:NADH pyrophosphatase NudC (nudix superfamily)